MKKYILLSTTFCLSCFLGVSLAIAQTCPAVTENHPSCEAMGFSKTMDCNGATTIIKCPFDTSYYFCHKIGSGGPTCDTSGVTMLSGTSDVGNLLTDGYCTHSPKKCAVSSQFMMAGIGSNNSIFSYEGLGCNPLYAQGAQLQYSSGGYYIGDNVYSEVPVVASSGNALMKGSAIFKGDNNHFYVMNFYDDFSNYHSSFSGGYNGEAIVLAGNTRIDVLKLETTKNIPLLVGDDSGKSVRLELYDMAASSTMGQLCIGLRPGGSVLVVGEETEYNFVVSGKKEIVNPSSGYRSSKPLIIATDRYCLSGNYGGSSSGSCANNSDYIYSSCDNSSVVCDYCPDNGLHAAWACRNNLHTMGSSNGSVFCY